MRDDSTVRLNAGTAAPDDGVSPVAGTVALRSTSDSPAGDGSGERPDDGGGVGATTRVTTDTAETTTRVSSRGAEDGHVPGPGLVIPTAARAPRERRPMPEGRPVMPGGPPPSGPPDPPRAQDDRGEGPDRPTNAAPPIAAPAAPVAAPRQQVVQQQTSPPQAAPLPAPPQQASTPSAPSAPASAPPAAQPAPPPQAATTEVDVSSQPTRTLAAQRPTTPRPPTTASARPAAPPRPAGPRVTGPGRPAPSAAPTVTRAPAAGEPAPVVARPGPTASRTTGRWRRAGGIAGAIALGLVAIIAASWTLLVPPAGSDDRADERPSSVPAKPTAPPVKWVRTNGDEFDGPSLDRKRWNVYNSVGGFGNGLRRPSAIGQGDGLLTITARPRLNGGTSGGISMGKGQLHGRWEFRARADPGTGYSPAVLLWPDSERFPIDGELDMLEAPVGDRSNASAYVHYGADNRTRGAQVNGDFTQWHTFAFEWLPNRLTWYVDGQKAWEITDRTVIPTKPMHLCIQLDQGPAVKFMPPPDATTPDEVRMQVDWARQYKAG